MLMSDRVALDVGSLLSSLQKSVKASLSQILLGLVVALLSVSTWIMPAQAVQITGNYVTDSQGVVAALRASLTDPSNEAVVAEAQESINGFYSRYHGNRYEKLQSFNTFRTVFNTLASNYRSPRPLKPDAAERVLTQLERIERDVARGN